MRILAAAALLLIAQPVSAASVEDWRADIDTIVHDVETVHPNAFTRIDRATFEARANALKASLPSLTEEQRMVGAIRLVSLIGDGHTQLMPNRPDFSSWYPVRLYQFTDGFYFTAAYKTDADLAGAQLLKIAGKPVEQVIADTRTLMNNETPLDLMEHLAPFHSAPLMKGLGYANADGTLNITVKMRDGRVVDRVLTPHRASDPRYRDADATMEWRYSSEVYGPPFGNLDDWTTAYKNLPTSAYRTIDKTRPLHFVYRRPFLAFGIPEKRAYYIQENGVGDWGDKTMEEFFRKALAEVDQQKPDNLIIDIRYNNGGDGSKVPAMIHQFIKREDNPPWKHLYVLTGRKTFSAALMMMVAFVDHTKMTLVGEPAGEPLDAYGDPTTIDLPRAGMEMYLSTTFHKLEDVNEVDPFMPVDVPAPFTFEDYVAGRDPAIDPILRGDEMRSLAIIALEDGGAAARKVFEERKRKYARYADWMHVREADLLHAYWKLDSANREKDAEAVARIMVELYPKSSISWGKLGNAQFANGEKAEGLASYRRALKLNPANFENLDERKALVADIFAKPDTIRYGASTAQLQAELKDLCKTVTARRIDPPFLDRAKQQMQIDCEGFVFEGKPRHAEFVIGDDELKFVWIMVTPQERAAIEKRMTAAYGEPKYRNKQYIGYTQAGAALRLDRSEVLFWGEDGAGDVLSDITAKN